MLSSVFKVVISSSFLPGIVLLLASTDDSVLYLHKFHKTFESAVSGRWHSKTHKALSFNRLIFRNSNLNLVFQFYHPISLHSSKHKFILGYFLSSWQDNKDKLSKISKMSWSSTHLWMISVHPHVSILTFHFCINVVLIINVTHTTGNFHVFLPRTQSYLEKTHTHFLRNSWSPQSDIFIFHISYRQKILDLHGWSFI